MLCNDVERWDAVGMGEKFRREGTCVHLEVIDVVVGQKEGGDMCTPRADRHSPVAERGRGHVCTYG